MTEWIFVIYFLSLPLVFVESQAFFRKVFNVFLTFSIDIVMMVKY